MGLHLRDDINRQKQADSYEFLIPGSLSLDKQKKQSEGLNKDGSELV